MEMCTRVHQKNVQNVHSNTTPKILNNLTLKITQTFINNKNG